MQILGQRKFTCKEARSSSSESASSLVHCREAAFRAAGMLCLAWRGCTRGNQVPEELQMQLDWLKTAACLEEPSVAVVALQGLGDCISLW